MAMQRQTDAGSNRETAGRPLPSPEKTKNCQEGTVGVVVPTTVEPVLVHDIIGRPRLRTSLVTRVGDYRPLAVSKDYAHLVSGPLADHVGQGPYQLVLDGDLETGRSWELPVAIAHLLREHARLAVPETLSPAAAGPEEAEKSAAASVLVWATGKLDANLTPQADNYHIDLKLKRSASMLERAAGEGVQILFAVPSGLAGGDMAALEAAAERYGARVVSLGAGSELSGFRDALLGHSEAAGRAPGSQRAPRPIPQRLYDALMHHGWKAAGFSVLVGGFGALAAQILSGFTNTSSEDDLKGLLVQQVKAGSLEACHDAIYTDPSALQVIPVHPRNAIYRVGSRAGLCGLRFTNVGDTILRLGLDPGLRDHVIEGNWPVFSTEGQRLPPTWETVVYFAGSPADGDYKLEIVASGHAIATLRLGRD